MVRCSDVFGDGLAWCVESPFRSVHVHVHVMAWLVSGR